MLMPNRLHAPLTPEERIAETFSDCPERLLDLAAATGNTALYWSARELLRAQSKISSQQRRRG
jgi:hypothetical protein